MQNFEIDRLNYVATHAAHDDDKIEISALSRPSSRGLLLHHKTPAPLPPRGTYVGRCMTWPQGRF